MNSPQVTNSKQPFRVFRDLFCNIQNVSMISLISLCFDFRSNAGQLPFSVFVTYKKFAPLPRKDLES